MKKIISLSGNANSNLATGAADLKKKTKSDQVFKMNQLISWRIYFCEFMTSDLPTFFHF